MTEKQLLITRQRIGTRLKEIREEKGLSQQAVADASGILRPNVARIEGGRYNVGIDLLAKIASVLECDIDIAQK